MYLFVVQDPDNSLWWVWMGDKDSAAAGTRVKISPKGWRDQTTAAEWGAGFATGVSWAIKEASTIMSEAATAVRQVVVSS